MKKHRETALKAADELVKRFQIKTGCTEAWGNETYQYLKCPVKLIIDTMMNLPLLWWAWSETRHNFYIDVAKAHIEMVKKYLLREDGSVAHVFMFDRATGEVMDEFNSCGYSNGSYWAGGTSWAICGFAIAGRWLESKDEFLGLAREYQAIAERLADNYIKTIGKGNYVPGILKRQNGNDTYTIFGDFYFVEALHTYLDESDNIAYLYAICVQEILGLQ